MRLLLIDDAPLYAEPLARRLRGDSRVTDVMLTSTREVGRVVEKEKFDVALINALLKDSAKIIRSLAEHPFPTIALGVEEDPAEIIPLAEAGASGYFPITGEFDQLLNSAYAAVRGELVCTPQIAFTLWQHIRTLSERIPRCTPPVRLTPRECEVLTLIAEGASNQEIARTLVIEVRTVKNHVHNILRKLGVKRRAEAAERARELLGWPLPHTPHRRR